MSVPQKFQTDKGLDTSSQKHSKKKLKPRELEWLSQGLMETHQYYKGHKDIQSTPPTPTKHMQTYTHA